MSWPERFGGSEWFPKWLASPFEDLLPIRSEAYGPNAALAMAISTWLVPLGAAVFAFKVWRQAASRIWQRWLRHDLFCYEAISDFLIRPFKALSQVVVVRFVIEQLQGGLLLDGIKSSLYLSGRTLMALQSGFIQHYLFWFIVAASLAIAWVLL